MRHEIEMPRGLPTLLIATNTDAVEADEGLKYESDQVYQVTKPDLNTWTGGTVWDSGMVLSRYLRTFPAEYWEDASVIELGCGTGLVGLTAAALGAKSCCVTDQVLHLARWNADQNFQGDRERVKLHELKWADSAMIEAAGGPYDLLLGSDILYDTEHYEALAETYDTLSRPGSVVLICTPDGSPDSVGVGSNISMAMPFYNAMGVRGFELEDISRSPTVHSLIEEVEGPWQGDDSLGSYYPTFRGPIYVVRMTKKAIGKL